MPIQAPIVGLPGVRTERRAQPRIVFRNYQISGYSDGPYVIDASESRDPGNTGNIGTLRAGLLMGRITASGLYAPSIVGVLASAYTSGGTTLTVSAAVATELDRLLGQSGTAEFAAIGPPTANGTVAVTNVTHSAINTSTGAITVTSLGVDKVAGTLIAVVDGRQLPKTVIPDGFPRTVLDVDGNAQDIDFGDFPVAGTLISANLLPVWPSDTSIRAWIVDQLDAIGQGKWIFDHLFA